MTTAPLDQEKEAQQASDRPASSANGSDRMDNAGGPAAGDHEDGSSARDAGDEPREEGKKKQQGCKGGGETQPSISPSSLNKLGRPEQQVEAEPEDSDSGSDDSDDDGDEGGVEVQLGFAEPMEPKAARRLLFRDPNWLDWDGGKIGGKPVRPAVCGLVRQVEPLI